MDTASLEPKFRKPAPYDRANIFSKVIFGYTAPTLLRGWRQGGLQVDDLYQSPKNDVVKKVARSLLLNWEREQTKCSKTGNKTKKPSFSWALFRSFLLCYLPPLTIYLITECIFRTAQPLLLGRVIRYFGGGNDETKKISYLEACLTAGGLCLMLFTQQTVNHPTMLHLKRLGMRLRVACCALLYQKSLRLSRGAMGQTSVAQTVNIMSNDCNRFDEFSIWVPYVVIAPAHTLLSLYFVYQYVGVASLAGIAFLVAFLPYQSAMARLFSTVRFAIASLTDARLRYLGEVISGIRVIKMYAWERSFALRIAKTRAKEVAQVAKACYLQAVNSSTYFIASKLVLFIILLMYVLISGNRLNAEAVFACMSLLNAVQVSMTKYFPRAIGLGAEVRITCKRIEKFLLLEETTSDWESSLKKEKTSAKQNCYKLPKPKSPIVNDPSLTIEHITARWNADPQAQQTLSDISVDRLVSGDLLAVVGSVGSGKSSLLMTLLKELPLQSGTVSVDGSLAYASQEAWSFNDSIRNNILFGASYEPERYRRVIEVCALKRDLQLLPHADQTLVGEKGVQLSGGQKARVNLARAVYRDADILLLDDPLSAVDATVAEHIFEQCIVGYLANKIRILVTHQLQFVEKATKILVLKEGSILAYGTWTELQQQGVDFMSILEKENEKAKKKKEKENSKNDTTSLYSDTSSLSSSTSSVYSTFQSITDSVERKGSSSSSSITSNLSSSQLSLTLLNQEVVKVKEELAQVGSLDAAVYGKYIRASGAPLLWITMITFTLLSQSLFHGTDIFLTYWTTKNQEEEVKVPEGGNNATKIFDDIDEQNRDIIIYSGLIVALFVSTIVRSFSFFAICNRASVRLHNDTFAKLLRAPVAFYDSVPAGRILNRLAKDLGITDETLPLTAFDLNLILGNAIGVIVTVSLVNWYLVLPAVAIFAIVVFLRAMYIVSARDIKRIEGLTRSPIYNHVNITISGLASIRAYGAQEAFERQFHRYLDDHSGIWYHYLSFSKFIGIIIDWIVVLYIASITLSVMLTPELAGGYAGLAISSGLLLSGITQYFMIKLNRVQINKNFNNQHNIDKA